MTAIQEMEILCKLAGKNKGVRLRHFTIGFSPELNLNSDAVFEIAGKCAVYYGDSYQIVYAVHTDTEHLHIHFVMNMLSYRTGKKYQGKKKDLYNFMNHCNRVFKSVGVEDCLKYTKNE